MRSFQKSRRFDPRLEHVAARSLKAVGLRISPDPGLLMSCPFRRGGTLVASSVASLLASSVVPLVVPLDVPLDESGRVVMKLAQLPAEPVLALVAGPNLASILRQPGQAEQI
jgi:hypothetical protein